MENDGLVNNERKCEIFGILMLALTAVFFLSLVTDGYEVSQNYGRPIDGMLSESNLLGTFGAFIAGIMAILVGDAAHLLYVITFIWTLKLLFLHKPIRRIVTRLAGLVLLLAAAAGLLHLNAIQGYSNPNPGGAFGEFVAKQMLQPHFGWIGSNIIGLTIAIIGMLLSTDYLVIHSFFLLYYALRILLRSVWVVVKGLGVIVLWLSGKSKRRKKPLENAFKPISDFCEQIPESAFPPPQRDFRSKASFLGRLFGLLKPRIIAKAPMTQIPVPAFESATPASSISLNAARVSEKATLRPEKTRPTIRLSPVLTEGEREKPLPFGEIPDVEVSSDSTEKQKFSLLKKDIFDNPLNDTEDRATNDQEQIHDDEEGDLTQEDSVANEVQEECQDEDTGPNNGKEVGGQALLPLIDEPPKVDKKKVITQRLKRKPPSVEDFSKDFEYPPHYTRPPLDLFAPAERRIIPNLREKLGQMACHLEETLRTFNLEARVTDVTRGPTITRFELEPAPGMKVSRFLALTDDIALALKAKGVRVEAPIPGKGRVGIEVSNEERDPVVIRELLEHPVFSQPSKGLELALGKDIAGEVCIADLTRMPHLLVAGATGAGKTVCIKALLASLLYHHTPDELQLVLIDPKMVELSIFNDIPHLITPVVTDPKKASLALQWLITEMEERYRLFADLRVRNIEVYNASVENGEIEMEQIEGIRKSQSLNVVRKLPMIVCVIDELADLMMLARTEVEESIMRLAQLARAVGIHLIIATQRPSVDVLTGVIKANFPARISFQVSSRVDSRCILDEIGAERLVGNGDMLFLPAGQSKPSRIQGAFVSDSEMLGLIEYLKRQAPPQYRDEIENFGKQKESLTELEHEDDPLLEDAIRVVLETGQASISMVQRRLRVGYTRAARLIDMMELKGIVGPHTGSKAREILVATAVKEELR